MLNLDGGRGSRKGDRFECVGERSNMVDSDLVTGLLLDWDRKVIVDA